MLFARQRSMIELLVVLTFIVLAVGAFTDLKTREVPDWLNFSAIIAALGIRALYSVWEWDKTYFIEGLVGFAAFFILACILYYLGQWGGGDSKMLMALGALIGLEFTPSHFMMGFFVNMLFVGGIYGLFWSLGLAIVHWRVVHRELHKLHQIPSVLRMKAGTYIVTLIVIALSFFFDDLRWALIIMAGMLMGLFHLWLLIRSVEEGGMIKRRAVSKLTEGDWVVKEVRHKGRYICGPRDLGLTLTQIKKLRRSNIRSILIKEGIPFIPSFLITFIVTYLYGNLLVYFL